MPIQTSAEQPKRPQMRPEILFFLSYLVLELSMRLRRLEPLSSISQLVRLQGSLLQTELDSDLGRVGLQPKVKDGIGIKMLLIIF